jgi:hypothetical protein
MGHSDNRLKGELLNCERRVRRFLWLRKQYSNLEPSVNSHACHDWHAASLFYNAPLSRQLRLKSLALARRKFERRILKREPSPAGPPADAERESSPSCPADALHDWPRNGRRLVRAQRRRSACPRRPPERWQAAFRCGGARCPVGTHVFPRALRRARRFVIPQRWQVRVLGCAPHKRGTLETAETPTLSGESSGRAR